MENKAHFGSLTPRMQAYRESVLDQKPYIDAQRAVLATESYKKNLNQPAVMKRALMLQNILAKMDIYIEDEDRSGRKSVLRQPRRAGLSGVHDEVHHGRA